ncbi:hypothetical protein D1007_29373 [Hordeum vulgare]|nr:hypothetical protein D1007_29373 [Hordeum vulgare]
MGEVVVAFVVAWAKCCCSALWGCSSMIVACIYSLLFWKKKENAHLSGPFCSLACVRCRLVYIPWLYNDCCQCAINLLLRLSSPCYATGATGEMFYFSRPRRRTWGVGLSLCHL